MQCLDLRRWQFLPTPTSRHLPPYPTTRYLIQWISPAVCLLLQILASAISYTCIHPYCFIPNMHRQQLFTWSSNIWHRSGVKCRIAANVLLRIRSRLDWTFSTARCSISSLSMSCCFLGVWAGFDCRGTIAGGIVSPFFTCEIEYNHIWCHYRLGFPIDLPQSQSHLHWSVEMESLCRPLPIDLIQPPNVCWEQKFKEPFILKRYSK